MQLMEEATDSRCHSSPSGYRKMTQLQLTKMPGGCEAFGRYLVMQSRRGSKEVQQLEESGVEVPTEYLGVQPGVVWDTGHQPLALATPARVSHARQFHASPPVSLHQSTALSSQVPHGVEAGSIL